MRLAECKRFAGFVWARVLKRRRPPPHLDVVMTYELAVIGLLRSTSSVPAGAWPVRRDVTDADLPALRPRRSPVQVLIELDVDLRPWIESADPLRGGAGRLRTHEVALDLFDPRIRRRRARPSSKGADRPPRRRQPPCDAAADEPVRSGQKNGGSGIMSCHHVGFPFSKGAACVAPRTS